jgi:hypothetical protein
VSAGRTTIARAGLAGAFLGCRCHDWTWKWTWEWIRDVVCKGLSSRKQHPSRGRVALMSGMPDTVLLSSSHGNARESERMNYETGPWRWD